MPGLHDAAGGPGHDEPARLGDAAAELDGLLISRIVGPRAGGAEDCHLPPRAIRREHLERIAQLAERPAQDLQVALRRLVGRQLVGRILDLADKIGNPLPAGRHRHMRQLAIAFRFLRRGGRIDGG